MSLFRDIFGFELFEDNPGRKMNDDVWIANNPQPEYSDEQRQYNESSQNQYQNTDNSQYQNQKPDLS